MHRDCAGALAIGPDLADHGPRAAPARGPETRAHLGSLVGPVEDPLAEEERKTDNTPGMGFEAPIQAMEVQLAEFERLADDRGMDSSGEIESLREKIAVELERTYASLSAWNNRVLAAVYESLMAMISA